MRYILKDLLIDTDARTVRRDSTTLQLPDLSFAVLIKLIEAAPKPVSIADFGKDVWCAEHVSDETIAQRITLLRKALGDNSKDPTYIRTVRGLGYAITGPVASLENEEQPETTSFRNRYKIVVAAGLALMALTAVVVSDMGTPDSVPKTKTIPANPKSETAILVERARAQLSLHQARETERAVTMLREALEHDPNSFDARLTLSFALSTKTTKFGGDKNEEHEAEAFARALINERPENSNAWSALAYALGSQGRIDESLSAYQYAYQLNPQNTSAISSAAHSYLVRGNLHQALLLEARAKQAGGTSRYAEVQIAQTLELIGHPAASEWFAKALSLNPGQVVVLSEIARSHLRRGNPIAALEILTQAQGGDQHVPQIMALRGRAAIALGDIEEARRCLMAAGENGRFDMAALNALAGDVGQATTFLLPAKLTELEASTWPPTRVQFAELAAVLGQKDQALRLLGQAVNLGWRDINWLKQSPFLGTLMLSSEGLQLESRIERELEAQHRLIEGTDELKPIIGW